MGEHFYLQEKNMNPKDRQIDLKERKRAWLCVRLLGCFRNMKMHSLNATLFFKAYSQNASSKAQGSFAVFFRSFPT